jgi:hypothetical protein
MSIISEYKLQLKSQEASEIITYAVSNSSICGMVAIALKKKVIFFSENGIQLPYTVTR